MLRTILVPLDGSALAERALPIACDLARRTGGAVHVVRAHVPIAVVGATAEGAIFSQDMLAADDALRRRAADYVTEVSRKAAAEWGIRVEPISEDGSPAGLVTDVADRVGADLIVMTTHGTGGFTPDWLGSVADSVIRHSHRPVLAVPENDAHLGEPFAPRRLLVTLDGSDRSAAILPSARDLAVAYGAHVDLIRVVAPFVPGDVVATLAADRPDPFGVDAETVHAKQALDVAGAALEQVGLHTTRTVRVDLSPTRCLLDHVQETGPDCLAIATQGRGVSRLFLGSVADKLIRSAGRPVLVLRPPKG
ncbi:MAG: universal stress protein [Gemmatimonadaceae bacterium]|nr:universal stress protein [Gemmatimonadaceae bacterium]